MFQSTYLVFVSSAFSRLEFLLDQNMQNSECTISGTANVMYSPLKAVNKYFITKICVVCIVIQHIALVRPELELTSVLW